MEKEVERYSELSKKLRELETKKIRLEEQLKAKKKELTELVAEIKKEGYDPTKLKETIAEKEKELKEKLKKFEEDVERASTELSKIEV